MIMVTEKIPDRDAREAFHGKEMRNRKKGTIQKSQSGDWVWGYEFKKNIYIYNMTLYIIYISVDRNNKGNT